jgi:1-deoxy-D-xylulose-5-phosphate synthase
LDNILKNINSEVDLKKLDINQLKQLAGEIRDFLIKNIAKTGGHLASNLGVIELTLALHKVFDISQDKIVWDVGHQAYIHKIITGRKEEFDSLRKIDGLSGFPKVSESPQDCFNTGHSSTSISAALGIARARDIKKEKYSVAAVIGDGALTGGMSFEALNDAGRALNDFIVIINDNEMSISKNVGGLSRYLSKIRTDPFYTKAKEDMDNLLKMIPAIGKSAIKAIERAKEAIKYLIMPGIIFEELGFKYLGPIDGHNIEELIKVFSRARNLKGPVLIHTCTIKGKGYSFAEKKPFKFHGVSSFKIETGEAKKKYYTTYSELFGNYLTNLADKNENIVAITAAMTQSTGLSPFLEKYKKRFFDVGIAEQHAVTLAAGMASNGLIPVVAIYSTFLQRAYDQVLHDVALQNLHVVFAIDRAGIVGEDGETHQGLYDLSYMSHIPNMTVMAPSNGKELEAMLDYAVLEHNGPVAVRYPRGRAIMGDEIPKVYYGKGIIHEVGQDITIAVLGSMVETALETSKILKERGISAEVINARFIKPLDEELIYQSVIKTGNIATLEDNTVIGGFGSIVSGMLFRRKAKAEVVNFGLPDEPIVHGARSDLMKKFGLDAQTLAEKIMIFLSKRLIMKSSPEITGGQIGKRQA